MPPKKAAAVSADPPPVEASSEQKEETKTDAATLRKIADHPSVRNMVVEALKVLDSRKGVSNQAMQNYIKRKWLMDPARLKHLVRKELIKGLENGSYVRPPGSTVTTGVMGKFRLASKMKTAKPKSENVNPNVQKAPKIVKDGAKTQKTGDKKKDAASKEDKSKEPKPPKKAEEASSSKVAPAKKPKVKKVEPKESGGASDAAKPKAKASKVTKEKKADDDAPASKAPAKRAKRTAE